MRRSRASGITRSRGASVLLLGRRQPRRTVHAPANCSATKTSTSTWWSLASRRSRRCLKDNYDCVVLDLRLPDMTGFEVLAQLRDNPNLKDLPVVVFTGRELTPDEDAQLHTLARSVVVKDVESPERLLDETALFLHRVIADLPREKQQMLDRLHRSDDALGRAQGAGRRRRRAQHLCGQQRARTPRHDGALRRHRARGHCR